MAEEFWGDTTDPRKHNPDNYRYLVHAFNAASNVRGVDLSLKLAQSGEISPSNLSQGDQSINLYREPERVAGRVSLSMSLIDQNHLGTWGAGGMIVLVPTKNLLITHDSDMGAINGNIEILKKQAANTTLLNGDELLAQSNPEMLNEAVALAKLDDAEILLIGFFL